MKVDKILFPTDFSDCADAALEYAVLTAKKYKASLEFLYVDEATYLLNPMGPYGDNDLHQLSDNVTSYADKKLDDTIQRLHHGVVGHKHVVIGRPYYQIVETARSIKADMIIMGTHGESGINAIIGSNAERIVRQAPCPVMTIRQKRDANHICRMLIPVDFSDMCRQTMKQIIAYARDFACELTLVYVSVSHKNETEKGIQDDFERFLSRIDITGVIYRTMMVKAHTEGAGIIECAVKNEIDVIAMGTHGRTGLKRVLMGSVTSEVVNNSPVPVVTFRSVKQNNIQHN